MMFGLLLMGDFIMLGVRGLRPAGFLAGGGVAASGREDITDGGREEERKGGGAD